MRQPSSKGEVYWSTCFAVPLLPGSCCSALCTAWLPLPAKDDDPVAYARYRSKTVGYIPAKVTSGTKSAIGVYMDHAFQANHVRAEEDPEGRLRQFAAGCLVNARQIMASAGSSSTGGAHCTAATTLPCATAAPVVDPIDLVPAPACRWNESLNPAAIGTQCRQRVQYKPDQWSRESKSSTA